MPQDSPLPDHLFRPAIAYPQDLRFRLATGADMYSLYEQFYAHVSLPKFRDYFLRIVGQQQEHRSFWLVAESGTKLIADCQLITYPHGAEIANLSVESEQWNRGIGSAMLSVMMAIARQIGLKSLEIGVESDNIRAKALYQRFGFTEDRRLRSFGKQTAIILCKEL